jgi:plasmid maintenance system antidote protein VapI
MATEDEIIEELKRRVAESTQRHVAESLGVAPQFLCDVLKRRRNVSETLANALGYRREFLFRKS